jgi:hypothetical protein
MGGWRQKGQKNGVFWCRKTYILAKEGFKSAPARVFEPSISCAKKGLHCPVGGGIFSETIVEVGGFLPASA